jgi:hypothetical protein
VTKRPFVYCNKNGSWTTPRQDSLFNRWIDLYTTGDREAMDAFPLADLMYAMEGGGYWNSEADW